MPPFGVKVATNATGMLASRPTWSPIRMGRLVAKGPETTFPGMQATDVREVLVRAPA